MSGYSTTGQWVVISGGRVFGPMDGRTPATQLRRELRCKGYDAHLERLWPPVELLQAMDADERRAKMRDDEGGPLGPEEALL